eukprot:SAG31_NODE_12007_length_978_cov_1.219568_1_plen_60_part_10
MHWDTRATTQRENKYLQLWRRSLCQRKARLAAVDQTRVLLRVTTRTVRRHMVGQLEQHRR